MSILLSVEAGEFLVDEDIAGAVEPALDVGDEAVAAVFGLAEEMRGMVDEGEPAAGDDGSGVGRDAAGFGFLIEVEALAEFLTFGHVVVVNRGRHRCRCSHASSRRPGWSGPGLGAWH